MKTLLLVFLMTYLLFNDLFHYDWYFVSMFVCVRVLDLLELELQNVGAMWVLEI